MVLPLRPSRGGFLRPFGCGEFIRDFLLGLGPHDSPTLDPDVGAPQSDIFHFYKEALLRAFAEDAVAIEQLKRARAELPALAIDEAERLRLYFLDRIPYKFTRARYHSFVVYFSNLQRLGWVEFTGREETSAFQEHYPPGPPRRYFRLTSAGRRAAEIAWSNPLRTLYAERWGGDEAYLARNHELRRRHRYSRAPTR
jgi:DNA-binding PadR family transcriptional regulator